MKHTKSVIAMILAAVLCLTAVCPPMGAEAADGAVAPIDAVVEAGIEELDLQEETEEIDLQEEAEDLESKEESEEPDFRKELAETDLQEDPEESDVQEIVEETESMPEQEEEPSEVSTKETAVQEEPEEFSETNESKQSEKEFEGEPDPFYLGEEDPIEDEKIAQAIWTAGNSTLTFCYRELLSPGGTYGGETVTNVWSGTDVTDSGKKDPAWLKTVEEQVTKVVFENDFLEVKPTSLANWFAYCRNLKEVDTKGLDTSAVTTMRSTFCACNSLEKVDVSRFDTSNVTDMYLMFIACDKLEKLDVSGFDTSKVMYMYGMFSGCGSLTVLDLSGFDVSKVEDMNRMFDYCTNLKTIFCEDENTDWTNKCRYVTMFWGCTSLESTNDYGTIKYDDRRIYGDMAQSATRGGYFTPKPSLKIKYLEVGIGGNVTVHWKNGGDDISGYKVRHRIKGTSEWRTTKVSDASESSAILKDLSPNDYEIEVCSYTIREGNEVETDCAAAMCPVPKMEILNPVNGSMFADSFSLNPIIEFNHLVENTGNGSLRVYDNNHNEVLSRKLAKDSEHENYQCLNSACIEGYTWNESEDSNHQGLLKPNAFYHISIDEKSIQFLDEDIEPYQIPVYFSGIKETDDDVWKFKTVDLSYPGLINPNGLKIDEQYYKRLFGIKWREAYEKGDGSSGHCFGLSFTVGAYKLNYSYLKKLTSGYSKLSDVPIGEDSDLLKYVQIAHLLQLYSAYTRYEKEDSVYKLYDAVKSGKNVIIDLKTSGGNEHSVYSIGIIDESDPSEIKIAVYDPNYPSFDVSDTEKYQTFIGVVNLSKGLSNTSWEFSYETHLNKYDITGFREMEQDYDSLIEETMNSVAHNIINAIITGISNISFSFTGNPITPVPIVTIGSNTLRPNTDYTVSYENNTSPGIASVIIKGIGDYSGTTTKTFMILPGKTTRGDMFNLANNVKVTWKEVPGAKYYKVYREGVTDPSESLDEPVIVTTGLIGWDKQPGLTNGHAYRYKIVASLTGKGDPSGDSTLSYSKLMYRLKTVVIRSVKNTAPGKVTVKYDKTTSGDSYVLQYCEREDMVGAKTKVVLGASNTSYVIGGLKKGKTYYISIRVRKKVNGIDYYTTFGVAKKIKIVK